MHQGPWMVGGDFNNLLFPNERLGGAEVTLADIKPFQDCLHCCELVDIKAIGSFFTWNNKQDLETLVYSRIDRCLINDDWMSMFPEAYAYFMPEGYFDRCPCVVYPFGKPITRKPHFKYFNMWRLDPNFHQVVSEGWHKEFRGTQMFQHVCKLKHLKHGLKRLNKGALGDIENKVKVAKLDLRKMQEDLISNPMDPGMVGAAKILADELLHLKAAWYMFLEQKAKVDWTAKGDDNTHYFHSQLKHRRAQNKFIQIKDQGGKLCTESSDIQQALIEYYNGLLGSSNSVDAVCESVIATGPILNASHHEILNAEVSADEIRKAMFDIGGNKAPGPDGFNSQFYKDTWEITGESVIKAVNNFFTSDIISPSQSAFVKGRDIVENILICQDLVKLYNRNAVSPRVIMKIDLQKAYDSIEWSFVSNMLSSLNFTPIFTKLILECVTTPSYTLALNGENFGFFHGKRSLRQGDPLSPLIFVICMEYLSRILDKIQEYTKFKYHPLCGRIKLNHLAFADDLLLFCRGDRTSIIGLLRAFQSFSRASGLEMNKGKSSIYSNGVDNLVLTDIIKYSGMKHGFLPFNYLGIPISSKKLSVLECNCLVERVVIRIRSIGSRKLSYARRLVLIKSVLATLHNYWAHIFILPSSILKKITQICRNFLWTRLDNDKGSILVSWDQICQTKKHGGLGVTDIIRWNKAALGKYIWWLAQKKDHLWVKWVHSIYIKRGDWHNYQPKNNGSWAWRKLCRIRDVIKAGYVGEWWLQNQQVYTIRSGYDWLGSPCMNVPWAKFVWDSGALPKISFIGWLVMQGRLLTRERLKRMGIVLDDSCVLCANAPETHAHLFIACEYSTRCLQILSSRLGCHLPSQDWFAWWNSQSFLSQKIQHQAAMLLLALIYSIWWSRNHCRTENVLLRPEFLIARFDKNSFFVFIPVLSGNNDHYICACINFASEQIEYLDNRSYDDDFEKLPYFGIARIACDLMGKFLESKGIAKVSKVSEFNFVNVEFKWQGRGYSRFDCGLYMMIHMLLFCGKPFDCALGERDVINLIRAEVVSILVLSDVNKVREDVRQMISQFKKRNLDDEEEITYSKRPRTSNPLPNRVEGSPVVKPVAIHVERSPVVIPAAVQSSGSQPMSAECIMQLLDIPEPGSQCNAINDRLYLIWDTFIQDCDKTFNLNAEFIFILVNIGGHFACASAISDYLDPRTVNRGYKITSFELRKIPFRRQIPLPNITESGIFYLERKRNRRYLVVELVATLVLADININRDVFTAKVDEFIAGKDELLGKLQKKRKVKNVLVKK
ncbi:uncharacterized protein LOC141617901 [Silene latifolia]|uniref:uncharacterized protein LOC141617901 n=1 Tax=Silene latifolia TaxID=37657 RepID=UPI003D77C6AA